MDKEFYLTPRDTYKLYWLARYAEADLTGLLPVADPDGDRTHPGWQTLKELREFLTSIDGIDRMTDYIFQGDEDDSKSSD